MVDKILEVTSVSHDGGIDGYGMLKVGVKTINVAFRCKRWRKSAQRAEVDKFRGVIQGAFEPGIFFTTADFTEGAKAVSLEKGAVPIILLDGESIVDLMLDKLCGVKSRPMELYLDEVDRLFGGSE